MTRKLIDTGLSSVMVNSSLLMAGRLLAKLGTTLLLIFAARILGDSGFGVYSGLVAWMSLWSIIEEFGQTIPLIRRVAGARPALPALLGPVLALKAALAIPALIGFLATGVILGWPSGLVALFGIVMAFESIGTTLQRSLEGREAMGGLAAVMLFDRSLYLLIGGGALVWSRSIEGFALGLVISSGLSAAGVFSLLGIRYGWPSLRVNLQDWSELLREARPFVLAAVLSVIYSRVDIMLLTSLTTSAIVGQFGVASRYVEAWTFIPLAITTSVFPRVARLWKARQTDELRAFVRRMTAIVVPVAFGLALTMSLSASLVLPILFSNQYVEAIVPAQWMAVYLCCMALNAFFGSILIAMNRESISTWMLGLGAVLSVLANAVMIPAWGANGAAGARSLVEVLVLVPQVWLSVRLVRMQTSSADVVRP